jgi:hypothetical protein
VVSGKLYRGQKILLCSDGLTSELEDETIARIMGRGLSESNCVAKLVQTANDCGGEDNTTVILVQSPMAAPAKEQGDTQPMDAIQVDRPEGLRQTRSPKKRSLIVGVLCILIILAACWGYYLFLETEKNTISSQPVIEPEPNEISGPPPAALPQEKEKPTSDQDEIIFHKIDR